MNERTILDATKNALSFLTRNKRNGYWTDFTNVSTTGESDSWVTAYVGYNLSEVGFYEGLDETISKVLNWQRKDGGWGYNTKTPTGSDETAWSLRFLLNLNGNKYTDNIKRGLKFITQHQNIDSGFFPYKLPTLRKYTQYDYKGTFDGWMSSHTEITANVLITLSKSQYLGILDDNVIEKSMDFIRKSQMSEGYWNTYWWKNNMYAVHLCASVLRETTLPSDEERITKAVDYASKIEATKLPPFYQALTLNTLLHLPKTQEKNIRKIVGNLIENQFDDGSWQSYPIIRIPQPYDITPWDEKKIRRRPDAYDHRRNFTTVTCFNTLSKIQKYLYHSN